MTAIKTSAQIIEGHIDTLRVAVPTSRGNIHLRIDSVPMVGTLENAANIRHNHDRCLPCGLARHCVTTAVPGYTLALRQAYTTPAYSGTGLSHSRSGHAFRAYVAHRRSVVPHIESGTPVSMSM